MFQEKEFPFQTVTPAKVELEQWVKTIASYCNATAIHWCDGSKEEYDSLCETLLHKGTFKKLNQEKRPNSFACFSDPSDVARVEDKTFICSRVKENAECNQQLDGSC
jgi:phosphoenolpyruvate carboxykinase (GTP)